LIWKQLCETLRELCETLRNNLEAISQSYTEETQSYAEYVKIHILEGAKQKEPKWQNWKQ